MATLFKIKNIGLTKFNNSEHLSFMMRTDEQIGDTVEAAAELGISADIFNAFKVLLDKLGDIVNQSRISDETAQLSAIDRQRDCLTIHLFSSLRTDRYAPLESQRSAAISLYNIVKPNIKLRLKPQQQKSSILSAILMDLKAPGNVDKIAILGLTETVTQLEAANEQHARLTRQRSLSQIKLRLGDARPVRHKTDQLYNDMMAMAFVTSISKPSARTADFIVRQNKYIDEANASYKLRKALKRKKPGKTTVDRLAETTPDKPAETKPDRLAETTPDKPAETKSAMPAETKSAMPAETKSAMPAETKSAMPAETTPDMPAETKSARPAETKSDKPAETKSDKPAETGTTVSPLRT